MEISNGFNLLSRITLIPLPVDLLEDPSLPRHIQTGLEENPTRHGQLGSASAANRFPCLNSFFFFFYHHSTPSSTSLPAVQNLKCVLSVFFYQLFVKIFRRNKSMGKRRGGGGSKKRPPNTLTASNKSFALSTKSRNHNPRSLLKLEHLQNLASWASEEASTQSLAAFFGRQFASSAEVLGVPLDPSALFQCQRCEIILQPGLNCTIRIEKNRAKARHREKKFYTSTKNNVVYKCHYCSHFNLKRGTPKVHMKEICPPKPKPAAKSKSAKSMLQKSANSEEGTGSKDEIVKIYETTLPAIPVDSPIMNNPANPFPMIEIDEIIKTDDTALPAISVDTSIMNSPATPFARVKAYEIIKIDETALPVISVSTCITNSPETQQPSSEFSLLDAKKKKRNRSVKNTDQSESSSAAMNAEKTVSSTSSKRKRKTWTSLKEIVEKRTR